MQELVAAFFHRVWERVPSRFDWQCAFEAYLRVLLVNLARDWQRRVVRRRSREVAAGTDEDGGCRLERAPSTAPDPERALLRSERKRQLREAFDSLEPAHRELLRDALLEGVSGDEACEKLGIERQAYYMRLHRAKKLLRARLEGLGLGPEAAEVRARPRERPSGKRDTREARDSEGGA